MAEPEIYGIGIDLIEVRRIKSAIERNPGFLKKIYTDNEVRYCTGKSKNCFICYAGKFAAKEAISKALKKGIGKDIRFNEIEIANLKSGEPFINLYGTTKAYCDKLTIKNIKITISGIKEHAVAFAISLV